MKLLDFLKLKKSSLNLILALSVGLAPVFTPAADSMKESCLGSLNKIKETQSKRWSRRRFLRSLGIFGAQMSLGPLLGKVIDSLYIIRKSQSSHELGPIEKVVQLEIEKALVNESKENIDIESLLKSYTGTFTEGNLVIIAKMIVAKIVKNSGNAAEKSDPDFFNDPKNIISIAVSGPLVEELVFRSFPSTVLGDGWEVGFPATVLFAAAHNIVEVNGQYAVDLKTIPITQFMGGVFYWYLMKYKGLNHAILAHMQNNSVALLAQHLKRIYP